MATSTEDLIKRRNALLMQRDQLSQRAVACSGAIMALDALIAESEKDDEEADEEVIISWPDTVASGEVIDAAEWLASDEGKAALKAHGYDPDSDPETWEDEEFQEEEWGEAVDDEKEEGC